MLDFFNKKKIDINAITLPVFGWILEKSDKQAIQWINPEETIILSLYFFNKNPDIPTIKNLDILRKFYREQISKPGGGIIQVDLIEIQDFTVVKTIFKLPQEPTGMTYLTSLTIPFAKYSYVIKIQAPELGMTGMRDSVVAAKLLNENKISLGENGYEGWFYDPYDTELKEGVLMNKSEEEKYDQGFPEHPLTQSRKLISKIESEIIFGDTLAKIKKFEN